MFNPFNRNPFYAPESDTGASGSGEVADSNTDAGADPFANLSFSVGDDEKDDLEEETEETEEAKEEETEEETEEEVKEEEAKEERTSKQPPEVDAAFARARKAEEKAAQLEKEIMEHKEWQKKQFGHDDLAKHREETEKQTQEQFRANLTEQWNTHLETAKQMEEAGYDERIVAQYLEAQKASLQAQEKSSALEQRLNQIEANQERKQREQERLEQEKSANEGKQILLDQHKALKSKYGDLVPDATDFDSLIQNLGQEMVGLISNNLTMEQAFKLVNFEKIANQEKSLTEKRTTANIVDRSKKAVETNKTEKKPEETLTEGQKRFAKEFGVDPKEVAKRSNPALFKKNKGVS